jgi:thiol:disulfide interchange protein
VKLALRACSFALLLLFGLSVDETRGQAERPVRWTLEPAAATARAAAVITASDSVVFRLSAQIDEGWNLYAPTQPAAGPYAMEVSVAAGWRMVGELVAPRPRRLPDRNFGIISEVYRGTLEFFLAVRSLDVEGGSPLEVLVRYQACTRTYCLPPRTDTLRWAGAGRAVGPAGAAGAVAPAAGAVALAAGAAVPAPPAGSAVPAPPSGAAEPAPAIPAAAANTAGDATSAAAASAADAAANPDAADVTGTSPAAADAPAATGDVHLTGSGAAPTWAVFGQRVAGAPDGAASKLTFLWLALAMGLLSLLTPCVFPMVPLTVSYFGGDRSGARPGGGAAEGATDGGATDGGATDGGATDGGARRRRGARLRDATLFGAGIVVTFTAVGFAVAVLFGAGSVIRLASSPWMNLAIAALFLVFALNLLGVLELRLPTRLMSSASRLGGAGSAAGATLMGGAFAITSFTCTAPFVGTLLVLATQGSWQWPLLGLVVYAGAFALPFFLLALAPGALSHLPAPGVWMRDLRRGLGILELAAAVKFVSNADLVWGWGVLSRSVVIATALAAVLLIATVAVWRRPPTPLRLASASLCLLAALWLGRGLQGHRLGELEALLPPAPHGVVLAAGNELPWHHNDYGLSLRLAHDQQRPVLVDFTGYTCTNCRWMEANMFPRPEVRALLDRYVRVRLYTDGRGAVYEEQQALQERMFGTVALPYYAILTAEGRPLAPFLVRQWTRCVTHRLPLRRPFRPCSPAHRYDPCGSRNVALRRRPFRPESKRRKSLRSCTMDFRQ